MAEFTSPEGLPSFLWGQLSLLRTIGERVGYEAHYIMSSLLHLSNVFLRSFNLNHLKVIRWSFEDPVER